MRPYSDRWLDMCFRMSGINFNKNILQGEVFDWWSNSDSRFGLFLGGERSGKSLLDAFCGLTALNPTVPGEYWVVGPDYNQARPVFQYLLTWLQDAGMVEGEPSMPLAIAAPWSFNTIWGGQVRTRSGADVPKLASFRVDGIWMDEAAQQPHEAYLKLLGRVSETDGFLLLSGTLEKGLPWYGDLYERWRGPNPLNAKSWSIPTWSNLEVYPGGRQDPRIKELEAEYPEDLFMERFGAVPRKRFGLVIPEFDMSIHVKHLPLNPDLPVHLCIDPAHHTYAVLLVQHDGLVTNVVDRVYAKNAIAQEVIPEVMGLKAFPLVQAEDAGTIDNAGKQHQANKSQVELWQEIAGLSLFGQYVPLDTTIAALRYRLGSNNPLHQPLVYFNDHMTNLRSPDGSALDVLAEPLSWSWPDRPGSKNAPVRPIDKNNDALKALGYRLVHRYGTNVEKKTHYLPKRRSYW